MTRDEALKYSHLFAVSTDFDPHITLPEKTAMARGFLEGYKQGVEDSIQVVVDEPDLTMDNLAYLRSHIDALLEKI